MRAIGRRICRKYLKPNKEAFGKSGEWYLDRPAGTLMYTPREREDMGSTLFIAPHLERLLVMHGDCEGGQYVEHVHLRGLKFAHTAWRLPPHLYAESLGRQCRQGFVDMPSAVELHGARHCRIERCTFANLGAYALDFADGCHNNAAQGNLMFDTCSTFRSAPCRLRCWPCRFRSQLHRFESSIRSTGFPSAGRAAGRTAGWTTSHRAKAPTRLP